MFFALQCIHLALEIVHLLTWQQRQVWWDKLMGSPIQEPPRLQNTVAALLQTWEKEPPLDDNFMCLMHDPRFNVHFIAMPRIHLLKGTKRENEQTAGGPRGQPPKKPRFNDREPANISDELKGFKLGTADGKPMSWHFNLSNGSDNLIKNGRCKFGVHTCMRCPKPSTELRLAIQMQDLDRLKTSSQVHLLVVATARHQAPVLRVDVKGPQVTPTFLQIQSAADGMRMLVWVLKSFLDPTGLVKPAKNLDCQPCQRTRAQRLDGAYNNSF